jgi:septal ring factor EnvC (AmiA/AmiB activator)
MYNYLDNDTLMDMLAKKDAEILELRLQLANEQTGNAEILAMLKEPDAEIASLKSRIKELDDALSDSQAHLAWAEQDSRALSELRQAARELINLCNSGFVRGDCNAIKKLEALLEDK